MNKHERILSLLNRYQYLIPANMYTAWVYILTNRHNTTLYIGVTNNLPTRVWEHRTKRHPKSFTARYNISKLVYYRGFESIVEAIAEEKLIKRKIRKTKVELIESMNPEWNDLFSSLVYRSEPSKTDS